MAGRARRVHFAGVYSIVCKSTAKVYIGSSLDICMRWNTHLFQLLHCTHHHKELQEDFIRFGIDNFSFTILKLEKDIEGAKLRVLEQLEMDKVKSYYLYNKKRAVARLRLNKPVKKSKGMMTMMGLIRLSKLVSKVY